MGLHFTPDELAPRRAKVIVAMMRPVSTGLLMFRQEINVLNYPFLRLRPPSAISSFSASFFLKIFGEKRRA